MVGVEWIFAGIWDPLIVVEFLAGEKSSYIAPCAPYLQTTRFIIVSLDVSHSRCLGIFTPLSADLAAADACVLPLEAATIQRRQQSLLERTRNSC